MAAEWTTIFERLQAGGVPPPGWLTEQRRLAAEGALDPRRAQLLRQLTENKPPILAWVEKYDLLCEFVDREKRLPKMSDPGQRPLVAWIYDQRQIERGQKNCYMPPERAAALEAVPHWWWDTTVAERWQERLELLREYTSAFGHMPGQKTVFGGFRIGKWTSGQILAKVRGSAWLTPARIAALEAVPHWRWRTHGRRERDWQKNLALLREYVGRHGRIPGQDAVYGNVNLGRWVANQLANRTKKPSRLTPERIAALEAIPLWRWRE